LLASRDFLKCFQKVLTFNATWRSQIIFSITRRTAAWSDPPA